MMPDRPIIFAAPMIRALLSGAKTQERRPAWRQRRTTLPRGRSVATADRSPWQRVQVGDRLWVQEAWGFETAGAPPYCCEDALPNVTRPGGGWTKPYYRSGTENSAWGMYGPPKWRHPIHMPRRASRLTLTVTGVRVQRLQEITDRDCIAEGIHPIGPEHRPDIPRREFSELWDVIHGPGAWDANIEVVAMTFIVEPRNIDAPLLCEAT
jgi:hypothetical protein